jgi:hypothetical protein
MNLLATGDVMPAKSIRFAAVVTTLTLAAPALAAAGDMNVATFLAKAEALEKKGAMALLSSDLKLLREEGSAAGAAYRARLERERAAGKPSSCPPKGSRVDSDTLLAHLRTYPAASRPAITMRTAMADLLIKTYPCR